MTGASTKAHPAPYPLQLAERLIRVFSFVGDTVLDPFMGTGTINVAAAKWGRNSVGVEVDPNVDIHVAEKRPRTLPGFYRPCKEWDLVALSGGSLVAVVEVKSQVGSFGNNFNNRVEEALGNATDFWAAYKKGIFNPSQKPWLGYIFMLEESSDSLRPKRRIQLSPYSVDEKFQERSYAQNYEEVCRRLVRELLYDAACFLTSNAKTGKHGEFTSSRVKN